VKALGLEVRDEEWENIAETAARLKKFSFAEQALKKISNAERANALVTRIKAEEAKQVV